MSKSHIGEVCNVVGFLPRDPFPMKIPSSKSQITQKKKKSKKLDMNGVAFMKPRAAKKAVGLMA